MATKKQKNISGWIAVSIASIIFSLTSLAQLQLTPIIFSVVLLLGITFPLFLYFLTTTFNKIPKILSLILVSGFSFIWNLYHLFTGLITIREYWLIGSSNLVMFMVISLVVYGLSISFQKDIKRLGSKNTFWKSRTSIYLFLFIITVIFGVIFALTTKTNPFSV